MLRDLSGSRPIDGLSQFMIGYETGDQMKATKFMNQIGQQMAECFLAKDLPALGKQQRDMELQNEAECKKREPFFKSERNLVDTFTQPVRHYFPKQIQRIKFLKTIAIILENSTVQELRYFNIAKANQIIFKLFQQKIFQLYLVESQTSAMIEYQKLQLPEVQDELVKTIAAETKNVVYSR